MSWVTIIWSMSASACLTLALLNFFIWCRQRDAWANLLFALVAVGVAMFGLSEAMMMRAETPAQYGAALRWGHIPIWLVVVALAGFVRLYLHAGHMWIVWSIGGIRTISLVLNFLRGENLNYLEITRVRQIPFLGESVSVVDAVPNYWMLVGQVSMLLLLILCVDATIAVWRRGERQRALLVGGSATFFVLAGIGEPILVIWEVVPGPMIGSPQLFGLVAAMGYELSGDILQAAKLGRELYESEQKTALAADAANLGFWIWSLPRDEVWGTEKLHRMLGFAPAAPITLGSFLMRLHTEDREPARQSLRRAMEEKSDYSAEYRVVGPDGRNKWISARGKVETEGTNGNVRMLGVCKDITYSKQADERFRLVVEASPNGLVLLDAEGRMVLINSTSEEIFGYTREELIGQTVEMLVPELFRSGHPGHRAEFFAAPLARPMGSGRELFALRKDGTEFPVEIGLSPIDSGEGTLVLTAIVDITDRKKAEAEGLRQRQELAHLSRVTMLGELSGSLAHELNQPLTAILSNAQAAQRFLAKDNVDLHEVSDILGDIVEQDQRAGEIIRRLRVFLKKDEIQQMRLDVNDLVQEVLKLMRVDLVNQSVAAYTELAPVLPVVNGDRVQLQQVLLNLLMNACDAMNCNARADRQMVVRTELSAGKDVCLSVSDCGAGLAPEKPEQVFEPFFTTKTQGLGLGLSICRTIITAHGGKLWAANNPQRGATFRFTLPAVLEVNA